MDFNPVTSVTRCARFAESTRPRGNVLIYTTVVSIALFMFVSLSVDYGRAQMVKTELQRTADAAARAAAAGATDGTYFTKATSVASANEADGSSVTLTAADVELGVWNTTTKAFTVTNVSPNGVRVTANRIAARGTAVPLIFARVLGCTQIDVKATSVAMLTPSVLSYGVVGLNSITLASGASIGGYNHSSSDTTVTSTALVETNGSWSTSGTTNSAAAYYRASPPAGTWANGTNAIPADVSSATPTTPGGAYPYGAISITDGSTQYIYPGDYSVSTCVISNGSQIVLANPAGGKTRVYVTGAFTISGGAKINGVANADPAKFEIHVVNASALDLSNSCDVRAVVNAPLSAVSIAGSATLRGAIVAKTINVNNAGRILHDQGVTAVTGAGLSAGTISTVK